MNFLPFDLEIKVKMIKMNVLEGKIRDRQTGKQAGRLAEAETDR